MKERRGSVKHLLALLPLLAGSHGLFLRCAALRCALLVCVRLLCLLLTLPDRPEHVLDRSPGHHRDLAERLRLARVQRQKVFRRAESAAASVRRLNENLSVLRRQTEQRGRGQRQMVAARRAKGQLRLGRIQAEGGRQTRALKLKL